jgi:hypothetical protein
LLSLICSSVSSIECTSFLHIENSAWPGHWIGGYVSGLQSSLKSFPSRQPAAFCLLTSFGHSKVCPRMPYAHEVKAFIFSTGYTPKNTFNRPNNMKTLLAVFSSVSY